MAEMTARKKLVYSYFPGCSLEGVNEAYDISTRNTARVLGMELRELDDWNCCGATAYVAVNEKKAFVLSARNLALAEKQGLDLVTVCSGCYLALYKANKYIAQNPMLRAEVRNALRAGGMDFAGNVRVRHFLEVVVNDVGEEIVRRHVVKPLKGLRVACYHGCQIGRPFGDIDDPEKPNLMNRLLSWLGAEPVEFPMNSKCCGGLMMSTHPEMGLKLSGSILQCARRRNADAVITACPLCQVNLEARQGEISKAMGFDSRIPIMYFTQAMGCALGLGSKDLALGDSLSPVEEVLAAKGVLS